MADRERSFETLLEELEDLGLERAPRSKRLGLAKLVTAFLEMAPVRPENGKRKISQRRERELDLECMAFCKAQEKLRELIAIYGTDSIAELADIRVEGQMRPHNLAGSRNWML